MSMTRKIKRNIFRAEAERKHYNPTKYLKYCWDKLQEKLRGRKTRTMNQAKASKPKKVWRTRIEAKV